MAAPLAMGERRWPMTSTNSSRTAAPRCRAIPDRPAAKRFASSLERLLSNQEFVREVLRRGCAARAQGAVRGPRARLPGARPHQRQGAQIAAARSRRVVGDLRPGHALHRHDRMGARGQRRRPQACQAQTGQDLPPDARPCRHLPGRQDPLDRLSRQVAVRARHRHQPRQDQARAASILPPAKCTR